MGQGLEVARQIWPDSLLDEPPITTAVVGNITGTSTSTTSSAE